MTGHASGAGSSENWGYPGNQALMNPCFFDKRVKHFNKTSLLAWAPKNVLRISMEGLVGHPNIWGRALSVAQQVTGASVVHHAKAVLYRERCNVRKRTLSQKEMN